MNRLALVVLIVAIGYVAYTALPSLTGNVVANSNIDSERETIDPEMEEQAEVGLTENNQESPKLKNPCEDVKCKNSEKTCPDGVVSSCTNSCSNGVCSRCEPSCKGHENLTIEKCAENWSCSDWSVCESGEQRRACSDENNCETYSNKPIETQTCVEQQAQLTVIVSTQNQAIFRGSEVEINVKVLENSNPVEGAAVSIDLTYASGTVVSNSSTTNSTGDYLWVKKIGGNSKTGTFQISAEALKEGYLDGLGQTSFEVVSKS